MALDGLVRAFSSFVLAEAATPERAQPVPLPVNPLDIQALVTAEASNREINPFLSNDSAIQTQLRIQTLQRFLRLDQEREIFDSVLQAHGIDSEKLRAGSNRTDASDTLDSFFRWFAEIANFHTNESTPIDNVIDRFKTALWNDFLVNNRRAFVFEAETDFDKSKEITLTKAQFAVVLNDIVLLLAMLEAGYPAAETCVQGYTVAHFAAIFHRYEMLMLIHNYDPTIFEKRTATGATVYDLLAAQGFSLLNRDGHICVHTPAALFQLWLLKATFTLPSALSPPGKNALKQYLEMKKSETAYQPPVCPAKVTDLHWGLKASQDLVPGQFILTTTGVVKSMNATIDNPDSPDVYEAIHHLKLDSSKQGGISSFIRHGPPNCVQFNILVHGQLVVLICALRSIKKGQELFYNHFHEGDASFDTSSLVEVNHYLEDTLQLTRMPQSICEHDGVLRVSLAHIQLHTVTNTDAHIKRYAPESLLGLHCSVEYHHNMTHYFNNSPELLVELVETKKITREAALDYFAACRLLACATGPSGGEAYRRLQSKLFTSVSEAVIYWSTILNEYKVDVKAKEQLAVWCLEWFTGHTSMNAASLKRRLLENYNRGDTEPFIFIDENELERPVYVITQLQCALMLNENELVKQMLTKNPELATESSTHGYTNAHFAAIFGRKEALAYLLAHGAALADLHPDGISVFGYYLENELEKNLHFDIFKARFQRK